MTLATYLFATRNSLISVENADLYKKYFFSLQQTPKIVITIIKQLMIFISENETTSSKLNMTRKSEDVIMNDCWISSMVYANLSQAAISLIVIMRQMVFKARDITYAIATAGICIGNAQQRASTYFYIIIILMN